MGRRFLKPSAGDVFSVPLPNGTSALGQVQSFVEEVGCVGCAYFATVVEEGAPYPPLSHPIAVLLTTADLLQRRYWQVLGNEPPVIPTSMWDWERFRNGSWVGATIYGSGIAAELMSAYHGLSPWDTMADPEYFDKLLLPGVSRPDAAYALKDKDALEQTRLHPAHPDTTDEPDDR